jgi:hypothetical protein
MHGKTITFEAPDYLSAVQWFDALRFLAPVVG